ncbi:MAG: DUF4935 domain-containing protein [Bacilli bacterium]|nr:DUF4935 domain-containing protein [Bacilli bacterium]
MKYLILDTNIYLNMVVQRDKSHLPESQIHLKKLLNTDQIRLVVPRIIKTEVHRHVDAEIDQIGKNVSLLEKNIKKLYWINTNDEIEEFNKIAKEAKKMFNLLKDTFETNSEKYKKQASKLFEELWDHSNTIVIDETPDILFKANLLSLHKKRPFQYSNKEKDSLADAIIFESILNFMSTEINDDDIIFFSSRNTADFSRSKKEKEFLHNDFNDRLNQENLFELFNYRIHFQKMLLEDFKEEVTKAGIIEELREEMKKEMQEDYLREQISMDRESVGLPSLSSDWEEILSEAPEIIDIITFFEQFRIELSVAYENLKELYDDIKEGISSSDLKTIEMISNRAFELDLVLKDNDLEFDNEDKDENIHNLLEKLEKSFKKNNLDLESSDLWHVKDYFELNSPILEFKDFSNDSLVIEFRGELEPYSDGTDIVDVFVNNVNVKDRIEVYYGYQNFDDNQASDGSTESITINLQETKDIVSAKYEKIMQDIKDIEDFLIELQMII